jgi:purine-nucleoside phosphorylase
VAAHWAGLRVCGVSLVTNAGAGLSATPLSHEEVLAAAASAGPRLARVIGRFAAELAARDEAA